MTTRTAWLNRLGFALLWIAVTAGIAFLVARNAAPDATSSDGLTVPQVAAEQRATVSLAPQVVQPVLSGDGRVVALDGDGGFALEAAVSPEALAYQLLEPPVGIRALIQGGPTGFDCGWLGLVLSQETGGMAMRCQIPAEIEVVAGLPGTMVLQLAEPAEVQALPVSAVVGDNQTGQVIVAAADGTTSVRQVEIGVADTFYIEITGGLEPDETVFLNPIQADFAAGSQ